MNALIFIINSIAQLYLLVLLLRFWLPLLRADFRNPIAQGILKLTSPLVIPLRRVVPSIGRIDTATVIVAFALQYLTIWLLMALQNYSPDILSISLTSLVDLVLLSLRLFMFAIIIYVILSWISPGAYNPATAIISSLVYPILAPFSALLPKPGGIDLSPILVIILLQASMILIVDLRPLPI